MYRVIFEQTTVHGQRGHLNSPAGLQYQTNVRQEYRFGVAAFVTTPAATSPNAVQVSTLVSYFSMSVHDSRVFVLEPY